MEASLPIIWACVILFGILMYIIMDGFDLGIGVLYPFFKEKEDRDTMMNTVAPVWDGNETWLILGGTGLLAAFPIAYAIILSALYIPLMLMLMGLILRAVAFQFRFKAHDIERHFWDQCFIGGSLMATFFQGATLGAYIQGITVTGGVFTGSSLDWISPFSLFTGLGLLVTYALLGSTWLVMRTSGILQKRNREISRKLGLALLVIIIMISIWTPLISNDIAERWFSFPNIVLLSPVPLLVGLCFFMLERALAQSADIKPFLYTLALVLLGYLGLGVSLWPNIVPPTISVAAASSAPQSQSFALIGVLIVLPFVLGYTAWGYYIFRGKVTHTLQHP